MKLQFTLATGAAALCLSLMSNSAAAEDAKPHCGLNTGQAATGAPIKVGGINGNAPPGDFSGGTDAAAAYFDCVNANGGIHGRPIEYIVENDQWNPELAGQVATKLVKDEEVVALVGNGSVVEMAVNASLYAAEDVMVMASGCAISECYESSHIVSTNQGPLPSGIGALKFAIEELGSTNAACIGFNIPNNGGWACDWMNEYMASKGLQGTSILMDPTAVDLNSVYLQALAEGVDTILLMLPAGPAIGLLKVAEEQGGREMFKWVSPTPLYEPGVGEVLGDYWSEHLYVNIELNQFDSAGPDNQNWVKVMDAFGKDGDRRDTFSQSGYISAKFFVDALLELDADSIDRPTVTKTIQDIVGVKSDLLCDPYYVGIADRHMPNHSGRMVVFKDGGFELVRDCYDIDTNYLEPILAQEAALGLN
ncbi:ABC transporter substrate-binding protein [Cognatishimia sp. SS12]|uniref:ABC transporter substrate-binding protein n=1 Tax=Cognatishimia sp. SS12 TaxID=2979465 RepID=UPI00232D57F9|nr:ABC transporter substrate-binding protein [Cognatishimia sp. SS12]MDC0739566.1 ABC transporter substrate-binding protein [Cognatishimia sp. SS12]